MRLLEDQHERARLGTVRGEVTLATTPTGAPLLVAILRVPEGSDALLKRVLDRGFRSIIVPMVNSAQEAARIAAACRYPPLGRRGYAAPVVRGSGFGSVPGYALHAAAEELLLIVQCEHADAVAGIEALAAVDGVDMVFIGPNDLAGSMGLLEQLEAPALHAAFQRVEQAVAASGKMLGTITGPGFDENGIVDAVLLVIKV